MFKIEFHDELSLNKRSLFKKYNTLQNLLVVVDSHVTEITFRDIEKINVPIDFLLVFKNERMSRSLFLKANEKSQKIGTFIFVPLLREAKIAKCFETLGEVFRGEGERVAGRI